MGAMIRGLFYLAIAGGLVYVVFYRVSPQTRHSALASVGLDRFFEETAPRFLREKLAIPQNPAAKRKKLIGELGDKISAAERELEAVVPAGDGSSAGAKLPEPREIRARIGKSREALAESEALVDRLEEINASEGILRKTAGRLLDAILPVPTPPEAGEAVGADGTGAACPCK